MLLCKYHKKAKIHWTGGFQVQSVMCLPIQGQFYTLRPLNSKLLNMPHPVPPFQNKGSTVKLVIIHNIQSYTRLDFQKQLADEQLNSHSMADYDFLNVIHVVKQSWIRFRLKNVLGRFRKRSFFGLK